MRKSAAILTALFLIMSGAVLAGEINSDSLHYYLREAGRAYTQNDNEKAVINYQKALEIDSTNIDAIKTLGVIYSEMGRNGLAMDYLNHALELDSTDASIYNSLAIIYITRQDTAKAIGYYDKALALDSTRGNFAANLALIYLARGDYNKTLSTLEPFARLDSTNARVQYLLGRSYMGLNRNVDAEPCFEKAVQYDDRNIEYTYYLAIDKDMLGKTNAAENGYRQVLLMDNKHFDAYQRLGVLYIRTDRKMDAMQAFEKAVALRPDDINANVALGASYLLNNLPEKADKIHTWLQKRSPQAAEKMMRLGRKN